MKGMFTLTTRYRYWPQILAEREKADFKSAVNKTVLWALERLAQDSSDENWKHQFAPFNCVPSATGQPFKNSLGV